MLEYSKDMILGIGTDIVDIRRIERMMTLHQTHFLKRVFTADEQEYCLRSKRPAHRFAKRFAAKEAFLKALGTGFSGGVSWLDVAVVGNNGRQPEIAVSGKALEKLDAIAKSSRIFLSLSDDYPYAIAYVVIEKGDC